jgi:hypothetical protein
VPEATIEEWGERGWRVRWRSGPNAEEEVRAEFVYLTTVWREAMREMAERNERELDAGTMHTNADLYRWNNTRDGVKFRRWTILRRAVTPAVELDLFEGEPVQMERASV